MLVYFMASLAITLLKLIVVLLLLYSSCFTYCIDFLYTTFRFLNKMQLINANINKIAMLYFSTVKFYYLVK